MASGVTDKDLGYKRTMQALAVLSGQGEVPRVMVGVRGTAPPAEDGTPMVIIAATNEFGSSDGHVPERSFLRSTADENRERYALLIQRVVVRTLDGHDLATELGRVGAIAVGDVQKKISTGPFLVNAPSTIARKGKGKGPLIDTGRLRQSIDWEVRGVAKGAKPRIPSAITRAALGGL